LTDFSAHPRRRWRNADIAFVSAAALCLVLAAVDAARWSADSRLRSAEVGRVLSEAESATAKARQLDKRGSAADATLGAQVQATAAAPPQRIVAELADLLPPDVKLQSLQLEYRDRVLLDLRVAARRAEAYDAFLQHLAQSPRFEDVVPGAESREGELLASVRMTYREADP
jgi:Tfp pilus assembly protein PilN